MMQEETSQHTQPCWQCAALCVPSLRASLPFWISLALALRLIDSTYLQLFYLNYLHSSSTADLLCHSGHTNSSDANLNWDQINPNSLSIG